MLSIFSFCRVVIVFTVVVGTPHCWAAAASARDSRPANPASLLEEFWLTCLGRQRVYLEKKRSASPPLLLGTRSTGEREENIIRSLEAFFATCPTYASILVNCMYMGTTPLIASLQAGRPHVALYLLSKGAHAHHADATAHTPLYWTVHSIELTFAQKKMLLIELQTQGVDINSFCAPGGRTVLHTVVEKTFCRTGERISQTVMDAQTSLIYLLLEQGANPELSTPRWQITAREWLEMYAQLYNEGKLHLARDPHAEVCLAERLQKALEAKGSCMRVKDAKEIPASTSYVFLGLSEKFKEFDQITDSSVYGGHTTAALTNHPAVRSLLAAARPHDEEVGAASPIEVAPATLPVAPQPPLPPCLFEPSVTRAHNHSQSAGAPQCGDFFSTLWNSLVGTENSK